MIKKLFSIFSGKGEAASENSISEKGVGDILGFVDYVVRALVDNPGEVKVEINDMSNGQVINIHCRQTDIGKIIGKNGKTIMAIRSLVTGAASRLNQQINVEVVDQIAD
ncbi:MAG TPA: KH domain-containing protein [Victivallales bacterium]|nr:KH domain-containing protein [Victivallales bacterium]